MAREGGDPDPGPILERYLRRLRELYGDRGRDLGARVLEPYRAACMTLGHRVRAITTGGAIVDGVAREVGPAGELVVETPRGFERVQFGEIRHLE